MDLFPNIIVHSLAHMWNREDKNNAQGKEVHGVQCKIDRKGGKRDICFVYLKG